MGRARDPECPACGKRDTQIVRNRALLEPGGSSRGGGFGLGKLILVVLILGGAAVLLQKGGYVKIPFLSSLPGMSPEVGPEAEQLKPPPPAPPPATKEPGRDKTPAPTTKVEEKKIEPAPPPVVARKLYPPVKDSDLSRAQGFYKQGKFSDASRSLEGCDKSEDSATTVQACKLQKRARILDALTAKIQPSPLAKATEIVEARRNAGGGALGMVKRKSDEEVEILTPGGISVTIKMDDLASMKPVDRSVLNDKIKTRIHDKEARLDSQKSSCAASWFMLGSYCWQYGNNEDAVPYLDKAFDRDDFPPLIRVFAGDDAAALEQAWCEATGKQPAKPEASVNELLAEKEKPPAGSNPKLTPPPKPTGPIDLKNAMAVARARYDEGIVYYKGSFGDSDEAKKNLWEARNKFAECLTILNSTVPESEPKREWYLTQCQMLLVDIRKRMRI